jgi:hypothetical protein
MRLAAAKGRQPAFRTTRFGNYEALSNFGRILVNRQVRGGGGQSPRQAVLTKASRQDCRERRHKCPQQKVGLIADSEACDAAPQAGCLQHSHPNYDVQNRFDAGRQGVNNRSVITRHQPGINAATAFSKGISYSSRETRGNPLPNRAAATRQRAVEQPDHAPSGDQMRSDRCYHRSIRHFLLQMFREHF